MVGKGALWKVAGKQRREKKKAWHAVCWSTYTQWWHSGLAVLVTGWVVLKWIQHNPSEVEHVWAEHLGWRTTAEPLGSLCVFSRAAGSPLCCGGVLLCPLCQRALVRPTGMDGLVPLTTSLSPPLLPPLRSLFSLGLGQWCKYEFPTWIFSI